MLDDNSGLYAGTLNIGHDAKRQHRFVESSFDEHTIILSELLIN